MYLDPPSTLNHGMRLCLIIPMILKLGSAFIFGVKLPCPYYDSINITEGTLHSNGSVIFNGIVFPPGQYAQMNYMLIMLDSTDKRIMKRWRVAPYIRGCICNIQPCLRLCCSFESLVNETSLENAAKCRKNEGVKHLKSEIVDENNHKSSVNLNEHFMLIENPCNNHSMAKDFEIHEGGFISTKLGVEERGYCLRVENNASNEMSLGLALCAKETMKTDLRDTVFPYMIATSVPFTILTFIVYITISELRNFHGKCFLCFLACLAIGYILISWLKLTKWNHMNHSVYNAVTHIVYVLFLSGSLWTNVISIDLWLHFRVTLRTRMFSERKQFLLCISFACGLPILFTIIAQFTNFFNIFRDYLQDFGFQPGFISDESWHLLNIFFHIPLGIIFVVNTLLFIVTALKIYCVQKYLGTVLTQDQIRLKNVENNTDKHTDSFILYMRMFFLMGVTGILETLISLEPENTIFIYTSLLNAAYGITIFVLFVLHPRVLRLLKNHLILNRRKVFRSSKMLHTENICCR